MKGTLSYRTKYIKDNHPELMTKIVDHLCGKNIFTQQDVILLNKIIKDHGKLGTKNANFNY